MCASDQNGQVHKAFGADGARHPPEKRGARLLQFYRLKLKHNINGNYSQPKQYQPNLMALMTIYMKIVLVKLSQVRERINKKYGSFLKSTALSNIILATSAIIILSVFLSKLLVAPTYQYNGLWKFLYIVSLAVHFGSMTWMSFVSGIVLYFSLPRHMFGQVQQHLFPAYYVHNSIVAFITVISFINVQPVIKWRSAEFDQFVLLSVIFLIEAIIRLYIADQIVKLKHKKTQIETEAGTGQEIGEHILGELVNCPHYMKILRRFRKLHSITAVGNITVVMCSLFHVYYLAGKLCL